MVKTLLCLPFLILSSVAWAETVSFSLDSAVEFARKENLGLKAARQQIAIAESNLRWSGRLADPEVAFGASTDQFGLDDDESLLEVAIEQQFPLTHRLARERELSQADLALAEAEVRVREWQLAARVRESAIDALALKHQTQLQGELLAVAEKVAAAVESAFQNAEASQLDVTEAQLEARTRLAAIQRLQAEQAEALGSLRGRLGLGPETRVRLIGQLEPPATFYPVETTDQVVARRPDLQLHMLRERRAEAAIALAKSQRWQDVAVRLFLEHEVAVDEPIGLERNSFVGIGFSLPLPLRTPEARLTDQPRGELAAAQASTAALAAQIRNEIATSNEIVAERRRIWVEASGETLELARRHVREMWEAWERSKVTLNRLQQAQDRALNLETAAVDSLRAFHQARAHLWHVSGLD